MKTTSKILLWGGVACLLVCAAVITSYCIGYSRGCLDSQLRDLPFDFSVFSWMHNVLDGPAKPEASSELTRMQNALKVMIFSQTMFYDVNRKRFEQVVGRSLRRDEWSNQRFEQNLAECRKIAEKTTPRLVDLGQAVSNAIKKVARERVEGTKGSRGKPWGRTLD